MSDTPTRIRVLDQAGLGPIVALHERIHESLSDPSFLYRRDAAFFERIMAEGAIVGAFADGGELVAYAAVVAPGLRFPGCPEGFGRLGIDASRIAFSAGGGVHPAYRGEGLMKRILEARANRAAELGADFVTAVVSPGNVASLRTLHGLGYAAVGVHCDDDGDNYLLLSPTRTRFPAPAQAVSEAGLSDHAANLALLREGRLIGLPARRGDAAMFAYVEAVRLLAVPL